MSSSYPQHDSYSDDKKRNQRIPNRLVLGSTLKTDVIGSYSYYVIVATITISVLFMLDSGLVETLNHILSAVFAHYSCSI